MSTSRVVSARATGPWASGKPERQISRTHAACAPWPKSDARTPRESGGISQLTAKTLDTQRTRRACRQLRPQFAARPCLSASTSLLCPLVAPALPGPGLMDLVSPAKAHITPGGHASLALDSCLTKPSARFTVPDGVGRSEHGQLPCISPRFTTAPRCGYPTFAPTHRRPTLVPPRVSD